jgi:protein TonB
MQRKGAETLGQNLGRIFLAGLLGLTAWAAAGQAQIFTEQDALTGRLNRARALAAANNLPAATKELESIRATAKDETTRDATAIMLMSLYFEQANYTGAESLLKEAFDGRVKNAGAYFATAGQSLRGVRGRLERYRLYSLNVGAPDLPEEAITDLDRMRVLLERMAEQSKALNKEANNFEASALLEDVATLRASLSRNETDRKFWNNEIAAVRGRMVESDTRIKASDNIVLTSAPANGPATVTPSNQTTAANTTRPGNATPTRGGRAKPSATPAPTPKPQEIAKENRPEPPPVVVPGAARSSASSFDNGGGSANNTPKNNDTPAPPLVTKPARDLSQPIEIGQLAYKATQKRSPTYPIIAKNARVTGQVKVFLEVDERGGIARVKSVEGPALLQRAAEDAARGWKFNQTVIDGQAVRVTGFIVFNFVL